MKLVHAFLFLIVFASCKGGKNYKNALLLAEKKATIDESEVVLSGFPKSLTLLPDAQLVSIVDYKTIVVYNVNSGRVQSSLELGPLFDPAVFDLPAFIKKNCLGYYKDRSYLTDMEAIKEAAMPFVKITNVLSSSGLDSLNLIAYIFCPYEKPIVYNNKTIAATWIDYWPVIINVNIKDRVLNSMASIVPDTAHGSYYPNPEFGCLLQHEKLYVRASPDDTVKALYEATIYDLRTQRWQLDTAVQYPAEYRNSDDWYARTSFSCNGSGQVYYNDIFNINVIGAPERISLKKFFDYKKQERICAFASIDADNFILSTQKADSLDAFKTFYFYNKGEDKLSKPALVRKAEDVSPHIIFKENKVIFISRDEQHYYIETYKIVLP